MYVLKTLPCLNKECMYVCMYVSMYRYFYFRRMRVEMVKIINVFDFKKATHIFVSNNQS